MTLKPTNHAICRLPAIIICALFILASPSVYSATSAPDFDNVQTGTLFLYGSEETQDAIVLGSRISMHIAGVIADVHISQDFENSSNQWMEGTYVFPLPEKASVKAMKVRIGERIIEGEILEKQKAKENYEQAKSDGQVAGLVKQERNNLFTTQIANIGPGEKISIELDYFQTVELMDDVYSLRLPTTLTPRYSDANISDPENIESPLPEEAIEDIYAISPPFKIEETNLASSRFSASITLESDWPLAEIISESHAIDVIELEDRYLVSLENDSALMNKDFTFTWQPYPEASIQPSLYVQNTESETFGLIVLEPPTSSVPRDIQNREVVFVIDTSGSMSGESIRAAKAALTTALDMLHVDDKFNVIQFNDSSTMLYGQSQPAHNNQITIAKKFIEHLDAEGGTEMQSALNLALRNPTEGLLRQIIFITDGSVGNEQELLTMLNNKLGNNRLFTVGIGSAPNTFFMSKAAEFGRGTYKYIDNIATAEPQMSSLFHQLQFPVLTSVSIEIDNGSAEWYPNPVPDLYAGKPLVLASKISNDTQTIKLTGLFNEEPWSKVLKVDRSGDQSSSISSIWARQKIENLMNEQWMTGQGDLNKQEIIELSAEHSVLSKYTAFLAIDKTPTSPVNDKLVTERIKNLIPAGNTMLVSLPRGSTGANGWLALSVLLTLLRLLPKSITIIREKL